MFDINNKIMAEVVSSFQIPVRPQILNEIQSLLDEEELDIEAIANLLFSDVGLSAAILKIINRLVVALMLKQAFNID